MINNSLTRHKTCITREINIKITLNDKYMRIRAFNFMKTLLLQINQVL